MGRHGTVDERHRSGTDRPPSGQHQGARRPQRLRNVLTLLPAVLVATNVAAYLVGRSSEAEASNRLERQVAALEADLEQVRAAQGDLKETNQATLAQLSRDTCALADSSASREAVLQEIRRRYGCAGTLPVPSPAPSTPSSTGLEGATGGAGGSSGGGAGVPRHPAGPQPAKPAPRQPAASTPRRPAPPPTGQPGSRAAAPPQRPPAPTPAPEPSAPEEHSGGGLICLPILGCIL